MLPEAVGGNLEPAVRRGVGGDHRSGRPHRAACRRRPAIATRRRHAAGRLRRQAVAGAACQAGRATTSPPSDRRRAEVASTRGPMVLVPQKKREKHRGDRIVTIRVVLFVLVFVAVLGGAAGVVVWFDKASFYVGLDRGYVAIFQGTARWPAVVQALGRGAHDAHAGGPARLERRLPGTGHGGDLLPGGPQPRARPFPRAHAGRDHRRRRRPRRPALGVATTTSTEHSCTGADATPTTVATTTRRRRPRATTTTTSPLRDDHDASAGTTTASAPAPRPHGREVRTPTINRRIRWLGFVLVACFALLFLQLNNFQVRQAQSLVEQPAQPAERARPLRAPPRRHLQLRRRRARLLEADQRRLRRAPGLPGRRRPRSSPASPATTRSPSASATGLESEYNQFLTQHNSPATTLGQLLTQHKTTDDITITVSVALQQVAATALDGRTGRGRGHRPADRRHPRHVRQPDLQPEPVLGPQRRPRSSTTYDKLLNEPGVAASSTTPRPRPRHRDRPSRSSTPRPSSTRSPRSRTKYFDPVSSIVAPRHERPDPVTTSTASTAAGDLAEILAPIV